jgi:uncharacterized protein YjiS (DUF1127 family)
MMILLQDGEALRIRGEFVLSVSRAAGGAPTWEIVMRRRRGFLARARRAVIASWLRLHRLGAAAGRRFAQATLEHAQACALADLDARTLKDIGLEPYLAERVEALQRWERMRALTARLGSLL